MGIVSTATPLTVYRIPGPPAHLNPGANPADYLRRQRFTPIDQNADERSFGFVNIDDASDFDWNVSPPEKGQYLAFSFRLDERKVNPALFKRHFSEACAADLADRPEDKRYLSKMRKSEIREQVMLRLRSRTMPTPKTWDVVWDMATGVVFVACSSARYLGLIEAHWINTFGFGIARQSPAEMSRVFESEIDGADFLTSLWPERQAVDDDNIITAHILDKAVMQSGSPSEPEVVTVTGPAVENMLESSQAISSGRKIIKARIALNVDGDQSIITADSLFRLGLRTGKLDAREDADGAFLERMYLIDKAWSGFKALFEQWDAGRKADDAA